MNNRGMRTVAIYMVIVLLAMTFVRLGEPAEKQEITITEIANYTQLMQDVENDKIAKVSITTNDHTQTVEGELKDGSVFEAVVIPAANADETLATLKEHGVEVEQKETPQPVSPEGPPPALLPDPSQASGLQRFCGYYPADTFGSVPHNNRSLSLRVRLQKYHLLQYE